MQNAHVVLALIGHFLCSRALMVAAALSLSVAQPGRAAAPLLCETAARQAAHEFGVPQDLLMAIALAESGRPHQGQLRPWPWAVNEAGRGRWFDSLDAAEAHVTAQLDAGRRNIDIGCFQLNHRWHGMHFATVSAMFDPTENARHAARFLVQLYRETGDWTVAAGAYHSRTPHLSARYRDRIAALLGTAPDERPPEAPRRPRQNAFPLLQGGPRGAAGSIVPGAVPGGVLIAGAARPLIGG